MRTKLRSFLPLIAGLTLLAGTILIAVQQDMRQSFNEPQIAAVEGSKPQDLIPGSDAVLDIASSTQVFLVGYDLSGKPLGGNGFLDGRLPVPPSGVFEYTKSHGEDRVTWQPQKGVRIASVISYKDGAGFVLAGRNMRELERRESMLLKEVAAGWLAAMALVLFLATIL